MVSLQIPLETSSHQRFKDSPQKLDSLSYHPFHKLTGQTKWEKRNVARRWLVSDSAGEKNGKNFKTHQDFSWCFLLCFDEKCIQFGEKKIKTKQFTKPTIPTPILAVLWDSFCETSRCYLCCSVSKWSYWIFTYSYTDFIQAFAIRRIYRNREFDVNIKRKKKTFKCNHLLTFCFWEPLW